MLSINIRLTLFPKSSPRTKHLHLNSFSADTKFKLGLWIMIDIGYTFETHEALTQSISTRLKRLENMQMYILIS